LCAEAPSGKKQTAADSDEMPELDDETRRRIVDGPRSRTRYTRHSSPARDAEAGPDESPARGTPSRRGAKDAVQYARHAGAAEEDEDVDLCEAEDEEIAQRTRDTAGILESGRAWVVLLDGSHWRVTREAVACVELVPPWAGGGLRTYAGEVVVAVCAWTISSDCTLTPLRSDLGAIQERRGKCRHLVPLIELSKCEDCKPGSYCNLLTPILVGCSPPQRRASALPQLARGYPESRRPLPPLPNSSVSPEKPAATNRRYAPPPGRS
jgi:hypothetical protein